MVRLVSLSHLLVWPLINQSFENFLTCLMQFLQHYLQVYRRVTVLID